MPDTRPVILTGAPKEKPVYAEANGLKWYHVKAVTVEELDFVGKLCQVNPFDLADCISQKQLPTVVVRGDYLFAIIHFPRFVPEKQTVVPQQVGVIIGTTFMVTVSQAEVKPVDRLFQRCLTESLVRRQVMDGGTGEVLYRVLDKMVDYLFPMLDKVLEAMESIEDDVFDERVSVARSVSILRRDITDLRRILFPMQRLVTDLRAKTKKYCRVDMDLHYEDLYDRVATVWTTLESAKERVDIYKDTDYVISTEKTNKILSMLTIIFTLSIPVTVVGALMGMNVLVPGGVETGPWMFLGDYTTFVLMILISLIPAGLMLLLFKWWRWI
ncbi:MAG: magnesium transporter CorA family protein [SAR202 cluster bacterium]|nr:magnesium transporter CorA family protein [SAR202 cluster bacterium]